MRYGFLREPTGASYKELLEFCGSISVVATLVIRELDWLEEDAIALMERLRPCQIEVTERSEWPGTRLIGHTATVYRYLVDEALVRVLQTSASRLYQWQQPHLPEDPAFIKRDGQPLLVTIAHEKDGYLDIEADEIAILQRYPQLSGICRPENA